MSAHKEDQQTTRIPDDLFVSIGPFSTPTVVDTERRIENGKYTIYVTLRPPRTDELETKIDQ